ncbi:pyrroloquinoline quinone biosynthesis protein PqqE [Scytonema millei]|nr:pyrroloquinoline quinone biosynthesis protein PqqE [Scytonema millei]
MIWDKTDRSTPDKQSSRDKGEELMSELLPVKTTDRPFTLIAELTYRCPLSCPYCSNPLNYNDSSYRRELATEDWVRTIQQARSLGVWQLGFSGGEPLVRQDLEVLVKAAAQVELYTTLVTAGTLFTSKRASQLCRAGLNHVQISIQDSRATESDYIAGTRCFEQKLDAARVVKDLGLPLTLNFVLHRQNIDRLEEMLELCQRLQADRVELAHTQYYGWALQNRAALLPTPGQLERAVQIVAAAKQRRICPMGILHVIPDYYEDYPKPCMGGWGRRALVIAPNGDAMPCQAASSIPGMEFANVRDRDLDWIWFESSAFNRFRGTDWMSEPCRSCDRAQIDFGGCRCQAFLFTNNAAATDPVCQLSPHHDLVVTAREEALEQSLPLVVHRSSVTGATFTKNIE